MAQGITITDKSTHKAATVTGPEVSLSALSVVTLPVPHSQVKSMARQGSDLVITLADDRTIVVHGFFVDHAAGRNDLVFQDEGGLWLSNLGDMGSLPVDTSVDTATGGAFSSIDSIDPLFTEASATAPAIDISDTSADSGFFGANMGWLPVLLAAGGFATALISSHSGGGGGSASASALSIGTITQNPSGTLSVSGQATPGDQVMVTYPDSSTNIGTADGSGNYSVSSAGVQTSGVVLVSDTTSSSVTPVGQLWTDSTAPQAPVVNTVTANADGTVTVAGTAEAGSVVTVTFSDGNTASSSADADGNYSVVSSGNESGASTIGVTATDAAGNASLATAALPVTSSATSNDDGTLTVSGTAAPGSVVTVTFGDDAFAQTVTSANGSYTLTSGITETSVATVTANNPAPQAPVVSTVTANDDGTVTITGSAEPGNTVTVTYADGSTAPGTAGSDGSYSITSSTPETSSGTVTVTATDGLGNTSAPVAMAALVGTVTTNTDGTVTVAGTAQPGSTVTVTYADGSTVPGTAGSDGSYSITSSGTESGVTSVTSTNLNVGGFPSASNQEPSISEVTGNSDGTATVLGTAEPGSQVTVTFGDNSTAIATAGGDGQFGAISSTVETSGPVSVATTDAAGNTASSSVPHAFIDITPPQAPDISSAVPNASGGITVTGTAEAGSTVTVTFPDNTTGTDVAASNGSFTVSSTSTSEPANGTVSVIATDQAGNASTATTLTYTTESSAPQSLPEASPTATESADGTALVAGVTAAGSQVAVTFMDGSTALATAQDDGSYQVASSVVQLSGPIDVTITDPAGASTQTELSYIYTPQAGPVTLAAIAQDSGVSATDFITNPNLDGGSGTLTFSGALSQPLATGQAVQISTDGGHTWDAVTVDSGATNWSYSDSANPLADGSYTVVVREVDSTGALIGAVAAQSVVVDTTAPAETVAITGMGSGTGASSADFVTADGNLTISGTLASMLADGSQPGVSAESVQVSLDGQNWHAASVTAGTGGSAIPWSFDNTAATLPDGLYVVQAHVTDAAGNVGPTAVQQIEVSASGTLNLSLADVLSDASALTSAGAAQQVTVNSGASVVTTVNLTDGVGTGATQWQDVGTTVLNGVSYDVYHNAAQGSNTVADLLIQHGITVI